MDQETAYGLKRLLQANISFAALLETAANDLLAAAHYLRDESLAINSDLALPDFAEPPKPAPTPPAGVLMFEDSQGVDVGPLLTEYATRYGVPLAGLVGLIHAESGFNTNAVRRGVWPDVSGGYSQMTVQTASGYGIGNGSQDPSNVESVLTALQEREVGIRLAAQHFASCLSVVDGEFPGIAGDERIVMAMRVYNAGAGYGMTEHYATRFASHIAAYQQALALAHRVLASKGFE